MSILSADFQAIAERINTGTENPETSRALVVFNHTPHSLSGIAVFRASMSWQTDVPLPPVVVTDHDGNSVPSSIQDLTEGPDAKGRAGCCHLSFVFRFAVSDVPANGWRTYLAAYSPVPGLPLSDLPETLGLRVVETLRHGGDLSPRGAL